MQTGKRKRLSKAADTIMKQGIMVSVETTWFKVDIEQELSRWPD